MKQHIHPCKCGGPGTLRYGPDSDKHVTCVNKYCWRGPVRDNERGAIDIWNSVMTETPGEQMTRHRYDQWAGNPQGVKEDVSRCAEEIMDGYHLVQCRRKRGHGPKGMYCKQHAKMVEERK